MANKKGFAYYNTDTDRYQDVKIKKLKKQFKGDGVSVYDYILCEIYRVKGHFIVWDESTAFDVAEYWDLKETTVNEIVNYCCYVGLFNKELLVSESILTSLSIQNRFKEMSVRAKRKDVIIQEKHSIIPEGYIKLPEVLPKLPEVFCRVEKSREEKSIKKDDRENFLNDQAWKEEFCMTKFISMKQLEALQIQWLKDISLKEEFVDNHKRYFTNVFNKGYSLKNNNTTPGLKLKEQAEKDFLNKLHG